MISLIFVYGLLNVSAIDPALDVKLPPGFKLEVFAEGLEQPRTLAQVDEHTVVVGTRSDKVFVLESADGQHTQKVSVLESGLKAPNGVAFDKGKLFIAEIQQIREGGLEHDPKTGRWTFTHPQRLPVDLLDNAHHGYRVIQWGPDHKLYLGLGAPCNICVPPAGYGTLARFDPKNPSLGLQRIAVGVRNSVGFDWDPIGGHLWFSDNGRDFLGDDAPPCELNELQKEGQNFGYPYCHGGTIKDPEFGDDNAHACKNFKAPAQSLGPHVAPLGIHFYRGSMFPKEYQNQIFIAEHGSWNRSTPIGYRISWVKLTDRKGGVRKASGYQPLLEGWLKADGKVVARPVAFLERGDGSLLISDDQGGRIFRLSYANSTAK